MNRHASLLVPSRTAMSLLVPQLLLALLPVAMFALPAWAEEPAKEPLVAYTTYKTLHLLSVLAVFAGMGALIARAGTDVSRRTRITMAVVHGLGILLVLVGGFGLMARIGIAHNAWPLWVKLKLVCWIVVGGLIVIPRRMPKYAGVAWAVLALIGVAAVLVVQHKPL